MVPIIRKRLYTRDADGSVLMGREELLILSHPSWVIHRFSTYHLRRLASQGCDEERTSEAILAKVSLRD